MPRLSVSAFRTGCGASAGSKAHWGRFALAAALVGLAGCIPAPPEIRPEAFFTASPVIGNPPLEVRFRDESRPADAPILAWLWNFGDGQTATTPNPTHVYADPGDYTVSLTVTSADGSHTYRLAPPIQVIPRTTFGVAGPEGGALALAGATINLPAGVIEDEVVFGVAVDETGLEVNAREPIVVASPGFTITHNQEGNDFYTAPADGPREFATITIPFSPEAVPAAHRNSEKLFILARLDNGVTVPIPGEVSGNEITAPVLRLPPSATYAAAYRSAAAWSEANPAKGTNGAGWADGWRISASTALLDELTALRLGEITNPGTFNRRGFSDAERQATADDVRTVVEAVQTTLAGTGFRAPLLNAAGGRYALLFFNMNSVYSPAFQSFQDIVYRDETFGNIVIDPLQLLTVSLGNARAFQADPANVNVRQALSAENAFTQALTGAVVDAYAYPQITTQSGAEDAPVSFTQGVRDGLATFLGQGADRLVAEALLAQFDTLDANGNNALSLTEVRAALAAFPTARFNSIDSDRSGGLGRPELTGIAVFARAFEANEEALLSNAIFHPVDASLPGYAVAAQDFFAYVHRALAPDPLLRYVGSNLEPLPGLLEELRKQIAARPNGGARLSFNAATTILLNSADAVFRNYLGRSIADVYWDYARGRAIDNTAAAAIRPGDAALRPNRFNEGRFAPSGLLKRTLAQAAQSVALYSSEVSALRNIPPLASRAVALELHPLVTELELQFNRLDWETDAACNSLGITIYPFNQPGVDFTALEGECAGGRENSIVIPGFNIPVGGCFAPVVILISNLSLTETLSVDLFADARPALVRGEGAVLDTYVNACDPAFSYRAVRTVTVPGAGFTSTVLEMTSGFWRRPEDVDQTRWTHYITIVEPSNVTANTAMLVVSGGDRRSTPPDGVQAAQLILPFVQATGSVAAILETVPNQPLRFAGESRFRSEDAILAYSFDQYLSGFESGAADVSWPALLPMTRAAVRAMDAVQEYLATRPLARPVRINDFVVAGASKRGWTTWLTGAADERVSAIMPIVIDVLNMDVQMTHHLNAYGFYAQAIQDYVDANVFQRLGTDAGASLLKLVDPYEYRNRLDMPKFIANATGDQFFLPDSSQFYLDDLPGENRLYYAANADHGLRSDGAIGVDAGTFIGALSFYASHVLNVRRPDFTWNLLDDDGIEVFVDETVEPRAVVLWQSYNAEVRDFRLTKPATDGPLAEPWTFTVLRPASGNRYVGRVQVPETGWRGFYLQVVYPGPVPGLTVQGNPVEFSFTTQVRIVPDVYPNFPR